MCVSFDKMRMTLRWIIIDSVLYIHENISPFIIKSLRRRYQMKCMIQETLFNQMPKIVNKKKNELYVISIKHPTVSNEQVYKVYKKHTQ